MKIIYVIDTNIFIHQSNFRNALSLSTIVIPKATSTELNGLSKNENQTVKAMAKRGINWIEALGSQGDLTKGVSLPNGAVVKTVDKTVSGSYSNDAGDDKILRTAIFLKEEYPDQKVILLTNDHGFLVLARPHVAAHHYSDKAPHLSYYDRLGVYERATTEEITQVYRALCKEYHPDHHQQSPGCHEVMVAINMAYEVLNDSVKRQRYDDIELPMWKRQFHISSQEQQARTGTEDTHQSDKWRDSDGKIWTGEEIWERATRAQAPPVRRGLNPFVMVLFLIVASSIFHFLSFNNINIGMTPAAHTNITAKARKPWHHNNQIKRQVTKADLQRARIEAEIRRIHNSWGYYNDSTTPFIGSNLGTPFADRLKIANYYLQLGEPENAFKELGPAATMLYSSMAAMKAAGHSVADYMPDKQEFMAEFIPACQKYLASHSRQDLVTYFNSHMYMQQLSRLLATVPPQPGQSIVNTSAEDWSANRGNENSIAAADQLKRC